MCLIFDLQKEGKELTKEEKQRLRKEKKQQKKSKEKKDEKASQDGEKEKKAVSTAAPAPPPPTQPAAQKGAYEGWRNHTRQAGSGLLCLLPRMHPRSSIRAVTKVPRWNKDTTKPPWTGSV